MFYTYGYAQVAPDVTPTLNVEFPWLALAIYLGGFVLAFRAWMIIRRKSPQRKFWRLYAVATMLLMLALATGSVALYYGNVGEHKEIRRGGPGVLPAQGAHQN